MENRINGNADWIRCPVCGGKTREKVRPDTILVNFPLFCPKCKHETIIHVKNQILTVNIEPAAEPLNLWEAQFRGSAFFHK